MKPDSVMEKREEREKEWGSKGKGGRGDHDNLFFLVVKAKWRKVR